MKLYKLSIFLLSVLVASSCKKLIDIPETDLIAGEISLKTVTNNEAAIFGAYGGLTTEMAILFNSTLSDEVATAGEFYNAQTTHEWLYSSTDVGLRDNFTAINPHYRTIDRVNRVIIRLPNADSTLVGDNVKRSRLRGEALFMRAYSHFELFRYYCSNYDPNGLGMIYLETPDLTPQPRINMGPYFQKMNADIAEAKLLLPTSTADVTRATVAAANALHARIALYQRDWVNAEAYATAAINAVPLATAAQFPGIWTDANAAEQMFRIIRTNNVGARLGSLYRGISATVGGAIQIGTVTWKPSDKLWNSYDQTNDVRFASYLRDEPLLIGTSRQSHLINKYWGTGLATASENVNHVKVYRTGEMYLIRAEARAEQNKITGANSAESDLNALRTARITGYVNEIFATKDAVITAIMNERFKELPFEGHRFWDLKRRNLPIQRLATDAPSPTGASLAASNYRFLLPIPQSEMLVNPVMQQNPGY